MRILIVSATDLEMAPLVSHLRHVGDPGPRLKSYAYAAHDVDVLTTGVGMIATAAWCSRVLAHERYDLGLNLGLCGSFEPAFGVEAVVHVVSDRIAELGAEDDQSFLTVQQLHLLGEDEFPFTGGQLISGSPPVNTALNRLPRVSGITVNRVHGRDESIAEVRRRFAPDVESMEGAAFMYAGLIHGLPLAQVRAVSNVVERRNRDAWRIHAAITRLTYAAQDILDHI
jgi:futalosine hydrolase